MSAFDTVIGIVGSPAFPEIEWSDEQLARLKELGCTTLQLSIAWASKPGGEVLNLEDLDARQRGLWRHRIDQAKKFGLGTIAHFGIPRWLNQTPVKPACILDPEVRDRYTRLVTDFAASFPEVDDILVYTFDQQAWICSDYGPCPRCSGIPLHERLPGFLDHLKEVYVAANPWATLWWEPWELSAGQVQRCIERIEARGFGLALHCTVAEVIATQPTDRWLRNCCQLAAQRDIPVVVEYWLGGPSEELEPYLHLAYPLVTLRGLQAIAGVAGAVGIKEYFGLIPDREDPNLRMTGIFLADPGVARRRRWRGWPHPTDRRRKG